MTISTVRNDSMQLFFVISAPEGDFKPVCRPFWADDTNHCEEQFADAIPDETISWIIEAPLVVSGQASSQVNWIKMESVDMEAALEAFNQNSTVRFISRDGGKINTRKLGDGNRESFYFKSTPRPSKEYRDFKYWLHGRSYDLAGNYVPGVDSGMDIVEIQIMQ
jgi:hypothetical protein